MKKFFEVIWVIHQEPRRNSQRNHTLNKKHYFHFTLFKNVCLTSLYKKVTYKALIMRRRNDDPNKGVAFK